MHLLVGKLTEKKLIQQFGSSKEFVKSATHAFERSDYSTNNGISLSNFIEEAIQVSDCGYDNGTSWGKKVSFINNYKFLRLNKGFGP